MNITEQNLFDAETKSVLSKYSPITLKELEADHLMCRFDEKYVFHVSKLKSFLLTLKNDYKVLSVNNQKVTLYENIYFDTSDFKSYLDHHNERANRYKIRIRRYSSSGDCFLEVKRKDNRGFTTKERLQVDALHRELDAEHNTFLFQAAQNFPVALRPSLKNHFFRITLVNEANRERVTLDSIIEFKNETREKDLEGIAIAEVKQEKHYYDSAFKKLMQRERIFPVNISKYCMGMSLTHPEIKHNRFKSKLNKLNKICDGIA
jgi:hypothetical protein